jgi:hypothetical protein
MFLLKCFIKVIDLCYSLLIDILFAPKSSGIDFIGIDPN